MSTRYFLSSTNSELSGGADFNKKLDTNTGLGSTLAVTVAASATETSYSFTEALVPGRRGSVGLQEYAIAVNVKIAANMNLKVRLRRITAAGTVQASSSETPTQSLNSVGVKMFEVYADLGRFEKDERVRVDFIFTDLSGAGTTVTIETDTGETWFLAPWDAGLLRPNMREALENAYVVGVWVVEMDLPSPNVGGPVTTVRGALQGASAAGVGGYPAKVSSIGRIPLGVSLSASGVESPDVQIEWEDSGDELSQIIEGPNGDDVIGSAVRIRYAVQALAQADWHTRFAGVIRKREFSASNLAWRITIGVDDRKLTRGEIPRTRISKSDFLDAPDDSVDLPAPQLFGVWNSAGVSNAGAVPTIYIDTKNFRYLVCHFFGTVRRVYAAGVLLASGAWSQVLVTVNGRTFMLIDFATDQGDAVITCDVDGYLSLAGTPFERPIEILYTWLENFVFLDGGAGITSVAIPALMNQRAVEKLRDFYEDDFELVGAAYLDEVRSPDAHLREFLTTWNYRGYWGVDGKLIVKPIDHRTTSIYIDDPWVRGAEDAVEAPDVQYEDKDLVDRITVYFLQDAAGDAFVEALEVRDPSEGSNVGETFEMSWGAARIV